MYFEDIAALIHMDGHGLYVWLAYAVTFSVLIVLCLIPVQKRRRVLQQYQRQRAATRQQEQ